ncbi:hypothetical protein OROHE_003808 [Orobanche hederae]
MFETTESKKLDVAWTSGNSSSRLIILHVKQYRRILLAETRKPQLLQMSVLLSASETLSTLKFAQRVKLIQNNPKVNEVASGDRRALQRQIPQLKGQLSFVMKAGDSLGSLSHSAPSSQPSMSDYFPEMEDSTWESDINHGQNIKYDQDRKPKFSEATLKGVLRREKFAETEVKRPEAEVAHLNHLAKQRKEDAQLTKMILRDHEEKFKRLELLGAGVVYTDKYLLDENQSLKEENELLRARFQNWFEPRVQELLLSEVSELRNKLLEAQESNTQFKFLSRRDEQDNNVDKVLEGCRDLNTKLVSSCHAWFCFKDDFLPLSREESEFSANLMEVIF